MELRGRPSLWLIAIFASGTFAADFFYRDFGELAGLRFNGAAAVSDCSDGTNYNYTSVDDANDQNADNEQALIYHERTDTASIDTVVTADTKQEISNVSKYHAVFPHRSGAQPAVRVPCPQRLRLTPSRPSRAGSVMRVEPSPLLNGFETGFTFQITDHSLACTQVRDRQFSLRSHQSCAVNGGDGFSFVLHNDANASRALGAAASGLGYAGLRNALVVEFDTWYNAEPGVDDLLFDHVSVQASPPAPTAAGGGAGGEARGAYDSVVTEAADTRLGSVRRTALGDGLLHRVRIAYHRHIRYDLLAAFTASPNLLPLLTDDGEQWRLGTLTVYVDDMSVPLLAMPLNFNTALQLPDGQAFVGFTAATGRSWQKHDILDWYWCDMPACPQLRGDPQLVSYWPQVPVPAAGA
jgi:hypothetical protein